MLCLYRCAEISEPFRGGQLIRPAIHAHVPSWKNFQNPARNYQYVLAEGSDAELDLADLDPACSAISARVPDKAAFRDWLAQPIGAGLGALRARCEADGIPTQDLVAADLRARAFRRILRTHEVSQMLWGRRRLSTAMQLLQTDPLLTVGDLAVGVRQAAQDWMDEHGVDRSDFDLTTPLWAVVRRICETLLGRAAYGESDPSDDFNRANETPIAGNWTSSPGAWGDVNLNTNAIRPSATALDCAAFWGAASFSRNHFSQGTIAAFTADAWVGVHTRHNATDGDCYQGVAINDASDALRIYRVDDTGSLSFVQLGSDVVETAAVSDVIRLESDGTTHRFKRNDVEKLSQTDATYNTDGTHVRVGVGFFSNGAVTNAQLDDWQGGDLTASPQPMKGTPLSAKMVELLHQGGRGFSSHLNGTGWWCEGLA